ncbi:MAG: AI-2E family transporter [Candidatus Levybacteria bacterium]|nr:AI-2E family transporter [Candidatus Levybacteria bacterium]
MISPIVKYFSGNQFFSAIVFLLFLWFLFEIRGILIALFIAYIITAALAPFADFLRKKRVPKSLAVLIPYLTTIVLLLALIIPLIPFFLAQLQSLFSSFPSYLDSAARIFGVSVNASQVRGFFEQELASISRNAVLLTTSVFGGLFSVLTVLIISLYLLGDHEKIKDDIVRLFAKQRQAKIYKIFSQVEEKLGAWLRGQVILSLFIGFITWIALTVIDLDFALPLALLAGMLEIIPTMGPIIAAVPAVIVALTVSPTTALVVVVIYMLIQAVENNILVPRIMEKAVGLHPVAVILGVIIGSKLLGVAGALLSIPFISLVVVVYRNLTTDV